MGDHTQHQTTQNGQNSRPTESHDDRAFDTMLRLLIMMEGELQTKEAIIEILMEGRSKDEALLNKLNKVLGVEETDPFSALKRDGVYSHHKWTELFMKENERDRAVLADSSRYLSACSSLRAISVARLQNQRYSEAYDMLQKTVRSYRKLKVKYTKERRKPVEEISPTSPVPLPVSLPPVSTNNDTDSAVNGHRESAHVEREQERCRGLEEKVEELTKKMAEEERQRMSIERKMRDEIRRLHRELKAERDLNKRGHCRLFISTRRPDQPADKPRLMADFTQENDPV
ncbi:uncharacterized protein LOC114520698 isoform X2 [Dendronephthya gigantea]|uniref:uncharacterized protein LOC114520698 isoform X2 n=1 Tax=Dendronephthya gigantea TaxID=151771 RepID=UPI00106D7113|nr:uncharacterized protein LOC114520698 isoform X2 [Dendronephthya gigantea]